MFKFIISQHWPLSSCAVWLFCSLRAAMADGVRKTVAFLATYVEELMRLQKPTLEAVLKSNRAKQVKEWKAAQNFWERKRQTLTVEQQNLFEDWEFVLCNMSTLETVAFSAPSPEMLPTCWVVFYRARRSFAESRSSEYTAWLKSQDKSQCPMSSFAQVFLERYWKAVQQSRRKVLQCGKPDSVRSEQKPNNELVGLARLHLRGCKFFFQVCR